MELNLIFSRRDPVSLNSLKYFIGLFLLPKNYLEKESFSVFLLREKKRFQLSNSSIFDFKLNFIVTDSSLIDFELEDNDLINVYFSKHQSKSGIESFSVHTVGNFSTKKEMADFVSHYGDTDVYFMNHLFKMLNLNYLKHDLEFKTEFYSYPKEINTLLDDEFFGFSRIFLSENEFFYSDIVFEATHHGPKSNNKVIFYEIGSTLKQWEDLSRVKFLCETFLDSLITFDSYVLHVDKMRNNFFDEKYKLLNTDLSDFDFSSNKNFFDSSYPPFFKVLSIGGNHTCSSFNKEVLRNRILLGPVVSRVNLENVDFDLVDSVFSKGDFDFILVDEKGLSKSKKKIFDFLKSKYNYSFNEGFVKNKDLKKINFNN